ncbi:ABC transporter substrate-binding protein [Pseudomonas sp. FW306-02-F02-AA]|uniref:ABC transporter substrate-binding protein n=1 Tax=Pseudomonas fluorescens TaxID=294 RepID=A0A0N7H0W6_PSEFL|nr:MULTISPECIES: transporter substrate-binding domain-containing protein [Pseudomonas]ALI04284.1 ABC transporter substrate-binding protein [Pseudomonas fluorescens]PMZ02485.1 ABC transporter substrate-binding protein [Pseudomonas sp. FW306-02-F02-AB]PMZ10090.1 ABC transporter substrate-binding protein [Pseudomonas sp. FW306-02-H06C]PMZ14196.1 ABC transporter substrate-binding protein [Pseudomonas sp. FW306-02-F02-AA]PMZ20390.1 ABC transporter substrate-binding protein [Pseudomonas sp. FW306-02
MKTQWLTLPVLAMLFCSAGASAKEWTELRFGTNPSYPPFESTTADGGVQGFGVDLGNAICAELKLKCVWVSNDFDGLIPALKAGKFDAIESSMTVTDARKKQIDFTDRLYAGPTAIVTRKDSGLEPTAESLKGKTIGFMQGTIQETYARAKLAPGGVKLRAYQNQDQVYADLVYGRLDASIQDKLQAQMSFLESPQGAPFKNSQGISDPLVPADIAIGVRKDNDELKGMLNTAIKALHEKGIYAQIQKKYFGDLDLYNN